jgi:hypothetical protein
LWFTYLLEAKRKAKLTMHESPPSDSGTEQAHRGDQ